VLDLRGEDVFRGFKFEVDVDPRGPHLFIHDLQRVVCGAHVDSFVNSLGCYGKKTDPIHGDAVGAKVQCRATGGPR
jgi:hypothetical protein